jgi:PAS domain S-box-containing protein
MNAGEPGRLMSVKKGASRHPAAIGAGAAALVALLLTNAVAFFRGLDSPWLLGTVIISDMVAIGVGVLFATREVLTADVERMQAREALDESEQRFAAIVEWSDDAIISKSLDGVIHSWNLAAEKLFGYTAAEAVGQSITLIIPEERCREEEQVLARIRRGEAVAHFETVRRGKDGGLIDISLSVSPIRNAAGQVVGASKVARDIRQRRQAEVEALQMRGALGEAQARLTAIVDSAMDAVITVDDAQKIVLFNRAAEQVFGMPREQVLGTPLERLIPARFRGAHHAHVENFGATGVTSRRMGDVTTLWALRADGAEFPIEASISQVVEGGRRYFTVILRDITLRKQAEDALKRQQQELRALSAAVLDAREEEKTHIARELHDELGQLLTALKMDLAWLRERLPAGEVVKKADEMSELLDRTVGSTRRISADLRPLMLDDLGLADAAAWLVEEFGKRSGVRTSFELAEAQALQELSKSVATTVYRALQESLTNIARHAGAKNAWVTLATADGEIHVEVEDDGCGISPADLAKARSLGLKGMRERFSYVGGTLEISRAPRGGTRLRGRVPMQGIAAVDPE